MSVREIRWRVAMEATSVIDRSARKRFWEERTVSSKRGDTEPLGILTLERADLVRKRALSSARGIVARSEQYEAGRFAFFGRDAVVVTDVGRYKHDPTTGRAWPMSYGPSIDYRHQGYGDPKWVWELNRLQHLPIGIEAWLLTGDQAHARWAARLLDDWIAANPVTRGIAWANGYEAGLRAISCALCFDGLRGSGIQEPAARERALRSLWQHAVWIKRRPSAYSSANNHRIGELVGLAAIGLLAPELDQASSWVSEALASLVVEVDRQILPDGTGAEQAWEYTVYVLDLLLVLVALLDARAADVPPPLVAALSRGGRAISRLLLPGEPEPRFGDGDDGRAVILAPGERRHARDVLGAVAARTGWEEWPEVGSGMVVDPTFLWLFGDAEHPARSQEASSRESTYLADGGIVVLRDTHLRVCVDVGGLGYLAMAAHGHADALQVTISDDDLEVIIDPGTGSYFGDPVARRSLRGTAAHATICVDGRDQAEQRTAFSWSDHFHTSVERLSLEGGVVVARHDGYRRLPDPVVHRRTVHLEKGSHVFVYDQLDALSTHEYVQTWPIGPHLGVEEITPFLLRISHADGRAFFLTFAASAPAQLECVRARVDPFGGWWSPRLEVLEPAWVCRWRIQAEGVVHCAAAISRADDGDTTLGLRLEFDRVEPVAVVEHLGVRREYDLQGTLLANGRSVAR